MRKKLPKPGDQRIITKFLWFPKTIDRERRWLEKATYRQVYRLNSELDVFKWVYFWLDWEWINK